MMKAMVVYVTADSRKVADKIAQALIEEKLAACVSIVPEIYSRYRWLGHVENEKELLLVIKTLPSRYAALEKRVKQLHSYTVPEILAMPVVKGNPAYLRWLKDALG